MFAFMVDSIHTPKARLPILISFKKIQNFAITPINPCGETLIPRTVVLGERMRHIGLGVHQPREFNISQSPDCFLHTFQLRAME